VRGFHNNSSDLTHLNSGFLGRLRTTYHWQDNKPVAKRCGAVSMPKDSIRTRVVRNCWYRNTFYYSDRNTV